jgi:hypothetical protein
VLYPPSKYLEFYHISQIAPPYFRLSVVLTLGVSILILFGSLARGNWDEYSDLDLDIIIADQVEIDIIHEIESLCIWCATIGEKAALIVPDGPDAGNVVLESLLEFSIRYHPLHTTNWKIVDNLLLLDGRISIEAIKEAGLANYRPVRTHDQQRP